MIVRRHATPAAWLADCGAELERDEALNSLALGIALAGEGTPPYLAVARDGEGRVAAAALMPHPGRLVLCGPDAAGVAALARDLDGAAVAVTSVHARDPLAAAWPSRGTVEMRQRLHALTRVAPVPAPPGGMRPARPDETVLAAAWIAAFERDALGDADEAAARRQAERRVAAGELFLWEDGTPRCMAARARRTRRTETINHVYTPPAERGRGFATGLVGALSQHLLAEGREACVLFTDLANPTSNAIYARIGYRPVADFTLLRIV